MEEGERRDTSDLGPEHNRLSGFADELASCLLKETISEAGGGEEGEQIWSIPCSSECHSHRHDRGGWWLLCFYIFVPPSWGKYQNQQFEVRILKFL